jgi:peptidoglycan biosynthesis protein MviN/MurJ (putative lipid II flippase)
MIKTLTHKLKNSRPSDSINSAALVIAAAGILSRMLGLVRDRILAAKFGAGDALDVYYAAFRVPDLIYNLLILGALSAAFIPVFTSLLARQHSFERGPFRSARFERRFRDFHAGADETHHPRIFRRKNG